MFGDIWVAYDEEHEPAHWALSVGAALARAGGSRLIVSHVAPPAEEPVSDQEGLLVELLGLREDVRRRQRLTPAVALAAPGVQSQVEVVSGRVVPELLSQLHQTRPGLAVIGDGRGRVGHALRTQAPCPVLVVRERHEDGAPIVVVSPDPRRRLAAATTWPLLVMPRGVRMVPDERPSPMRTSRLLTSTGSGHAGSRGHDTTLLVRLFGASAFIVVLATAILLLAPVSVSRSIVFAEAVVVLTGVAMLLAAILVVLRRGLAPLRALTELMGSVDPHHPGRRLPDDPRAPAEVVALSTAFNAMLDRLEDERRETTRRALAAQEDERTRIAREMHDGVGQTLTAVALQAERAAELETVDRDLLGRLAASAHEGLGEVRRLARELRPEALDDLGLGNALITLCRRMSTEGGVRVEHQLQPGLPPLTPEAELVLYRVAQEALTNALRHAQADRIAVGLRYDDEEIELTVDDDGIGMHDATADGTHGIAGMRERALLAGGRLTLESGPAEGTRVSLALPCAGAIAA